MFDKPVHVICFSVLNTAVYRSHILCNFQHVFAFYLWRHLGATGHFQVTLPFASQVSCTSPLLWVSAFKVAGDGNKQDAGLHRHCKAPVRASSSELPMRHLCEEVKQGICTWCPSFELSVEGTFAFCKLSDPSTWCIPATLCHAWFVVRWHCHLPACINVLSNMNVTVSLALGSTVQHNKCWQSALCYTSLQYVMKHLTVRLCGLICFDTWFVGLLCYVFGFHWQ